MPRPVDRPRWPAPDQVPESRRGARRGVQARKEERREGVERVEPAEVGGLEGAGHGEPPAERGLDGEIDRLGRGHPARPERERLAEQRELEAVSEEPVDFPLQDHRLLARRPQHVAHPGHHARAGLRAGADLHERDQLRRVPEVRGDGPLAMPDTVDEPAHRLAARGGQHGGRRTDPVEALEDGVLERLVLRHRLHHEVGARGVIERGRRADPPDDALHRAPGHQPMRHEAVEALANPPEGPVEALLHLARSAARRAPPWRTPGPRRARSTRSR